MVRSALTPGGQAEVIKPDSGRCLQSYNKINSVRHRRPRRVSRVILCWQTAMHAAPTGL